MPSQSLDAFRNLQAPQSSLLFRFLNFSGTKVPFLLWHYPFSTVLPVSLPLLTHPDWLPFDRAHNRYSIEFMSIIATIRKKHRENVVNLSCCKCMAFFWGGSDGMKQEGNFYPKNNSNPDKRNKSLTEKFL